MGGKRFDKDSTEFHFFTDFWKLIQKYYLPEDNEEYWESLLKESGMISEKYNGRFYKNLILAYMSYLEEEHNDKGRCS